MKPDLVKVLVAFIAFLSAFPLAAQIPTDQDCMGAIPVCEGYYYQPNTYLGSGNYPNEIPSGGSGCPNNCMLDGEKNCVWYYVTVQSDGLMGFEVTPNNLGNDYDWVVYDLTDARCEDIYSQTSSLQVSCNWSATPGVTGPNGNNNAPCHNSTGSPFCAMIPVTEGQIFVINISNWSSTNQSGYSLDFSMSTAQIYDDVSPEIEEIFADEVQGCSTNTLRFLWDENVRCDRVAPSAFGISGPGGPYTVTDVQGIACGLGGTWEKEYTLYIDPPFSSNGEYIFHVYSIFPSIVDACNNPVYDADIPFTLDLGAPTLTTSGLEIDPATCGMDNGSITGLSASGQTALTYVWKNSYGTVVGNEIDLIDVPAETYTLEVHDLMDCITYGGPWEVEEYGVPEIDDDNIIITSSNYGASNGSVTDIVVNSPFTIEEYTWADDLGSVVGSDLDLIGVPTGYYTLEVVDENTCTALAGPYFVGEIGGPLTTNPSANPTVVCSGDAVTLSPGAGGGSGSYDYIWTSTPEGFNSTLETPVVTPTENTTYHLQIFDGYIFAEGDVQVTVHPLPVPDAGEDQSIPHGIYTFLEGSANTGSGDYLYYWSPVEKLVDAATQNPQTTNLYETTPFFLTVEDEQTGCAAADPDQVIVEVTGGFLSANPSSFPDSVFCIGETFWLHANAGGGSGDYTYIWTSEPEMTLPTDESFSLTLYEENTYYFYVLVNDGYNETFGYVTVTVDPAPVIELGDEVQFVCVHETITLDAGNEGASYLWSNGDTNRYTTLGTTGLGYDPQYISVNVMNAEGCQADTGVTVIFDYDYCVGIGENPNSVDLQVYPNPTTGTVNIYIGGVSDEMEVHVRSAIGISLGDHKYMPDANGIIAETLDLSDQPPGIYFLIIRGKNVYHTEKILIQ
ncbi:MAG: T9SS type A sorting domain-containing protein [Bacteroidales bacterium]|nr:T9SS type A sorting domain-containing protein [Bacteroidales bacterium]